MFLNRLGVRCWQQGDSGSIPSQAGLIPLEANPFFSACYLDPALRHLADRNVFALTISDACGALISAPFISRTRFRSVPLRTLNTWTHPFQFLATPLLSAANAELAINALLELCDTHPDQPTLLILSDLRIDGEFFGALKSQLQAHARPWLELQRFNRAALRGGISFEQHITKQLSSKRRKELERKRAQLQKLGMLQFENLARPEEIDIWLEQFLLIEASGWKGRAGSALAQDKKQRAFFLSACRESFQAGALRILRLCLSGQPLAMHISLTSGRNAYAIKIAYDDSYARFSPGALLELENMRRVLDLSEFDFMDSCALPNHELFKRLWCDQTTIGTVAIAADSTAARAILSTIRFTQKMRHFSKSLLRKRDV